MSGCLGESKGDEKVAWGVTTQTAGSSHKEFYLPGGKANKSESSEVVSVFALSQEPTEWGLDNPLHGRCELQWYSSLNIIC